MQKTPKSLRLHIGIFGKRNAGKSSIINEITHQNTSIVSDIAGTTTDSVEKPMEMLPLGPVVFIDTAGIDDSGELGEKRTEKTMQITDRCDIAVIVCTPHGWDKYEINLFEKLKALNIPVISIVNKIDTGDISSEKLDEIKNYTSAVILTSALNDKDIEIKVKEALIENVPDEFITLSSPVENIIEKNEFAILVTPIDKEAPKGRLILPEVQVLRALLDKNCLSVVVQENELNYAINNLKLKPRIVITDSQAFKSVNEIVPSDINLTSFSILFARLKGDLDEFIKGAKVIDSLNDNDKVLVCESCTHHRIEDDIGTVKIPNLIRKKTRKNIIFEHYSSHQFPVNAEQYKLIVHCGGCMTNRREILSRILKAKKAQVPITNYGIAIAYCLGILERATEVFK